MRIMRKIIKKHAKLRLKSRKSMRSRRSKHILAKFAKDKKDSNKNNALQKNLSVDQKSKNEKHSNIDKKKRAVKKVLHQKKK